MFTATALGYEYVMNARTQAAWTYPSAAAMQRAVVEVEDACLTPAYLRFISTTPSQGMTSGQPSPRPWYMDAKSAAAQRHAAHLYRNAEIVLPVMVENPRTARSRAALLRSARLVARVGHVRGRLPGQVVPVQSRIGWRSWL
jgi:hypothetical protein